MTLQQSVTRNEFIAERYRYATSNIQQNNSLSPYRKRYLIKEEIDRAISCFN